MDYLTVLVDLIEKLSMVALDYFMHLTILFQRSLVRDLKLNTKIKLFLRVFTRVLLSIFILVLLLKRLLQLVFLSKCLKQVEVGNLLQLILSELHKVKGRY